jgi:hypothetical protein
MATNANQREDRVSTPTPKPTPAAKPAPAAKPPVAAKPTPPKSAPSAKVTTEEVLKQLAEAGARAAEQQARVDALLKEEQDRLKRVADGKAEQDKKLEEKDDDKSTRDAFAILKNIFASYGLSDLSATIEGFMKSGLTTSEATIELKKTKAYEDRFYGNKLRAASGLNVLDEAAYLDLENSYSETLKAYGLQDYFGVAVTPEQRLARQKNIAEVMGKDISAVEFKERVSTAVERVTNADTQTKAAFKSLYNVTDSELVKYFLDPAKNVQALKEKAAAAEIGGAALGQGLTTTAASAEELARMGVTKAQAQQGYATIAEILPTAEKLSSIYDEDKITYGQAEAEAETFKGLASAQRKRQQLAAKEVASFSGQSGLSKGALGTKGSF